MEVLFALHVLQKNAVLSGLLDQSGDRNEKS